MPGSGGAGPAGWVAVIRAARAKRLRQREPVAIAAAEPLEVPGPRRQALYVTVDLAAGSWLLVDQNGVEAKLGGAGRGREAGGPGPDHRQIAQAGHASGSRGPARRRTDRPSRTGVRQARRSPTPTISTRQPKHDPIMQ